jgi:hypothetical protein
MGIPNICKTQRARSGRTLFSVTISLWLEFGDVPLADARERMRSLRSLLRRDSLRAPSKLHAARKRQPPDRTRHRRSLSPRVRDSRAVSDLGASTHRRAFERIGSAAKPPCPHRGSSACRRPRHLGMPQTDRAPSASIEGYRRSSLERWVIFAGDRSEGHRGAGWDRHCWLPARRARHLRRLHASPGQAHRFCARSRGARTAPELGPHFLNPGQTAFPETPDSDWNPA